MDSYGYVSPFTGAHQYGAGTLTTTRSEAAHMTGLDALPDDWVVWNDEADGPAVVAYRPDVFDTQTFPPECMPTLYLTRGPHRNRPRRRGRSATANSRWHVTLYLEPDVEYDDHPECDARSNAVEELVRIARRFADGDVDYRGLYQHPREAYLDELDDLTGRDRASEA